MVLTSNVSFRTSIVVSACTVSPFFSFSLPGPSLPQVVVTLWFGNMLGATSSATEKPSRLSNCRKKVLQSSLLLTSKNQSSVIKVF